MTSLSRTRDKLAVRAFCFLRLYDIVPAGGVSFERRNPGTRFARMCGAEGMHGWKNERRGYL
jgi:hypothetical protein